MTLTLRTQRSLQALVLAGLGLFLLQKAWDGTLYEYINQRFVWLIGPTAAGLLTLAALALPRPRRAEAAGHDDHQERTHDHDDSHGHAAGSQAGLWGLLALAVPLALGLLIPARPLGTVAIANRGINISVPLAAGGGAAGPWERAAGDRNVLDWVRAFNGTSDPSDYNGQAADVIGFVYHGAGPAEEQFLVSRFVMPCCAADATAVGVLVAWPGAAELADNGWVRVRGVMAVGSLGGRPTPLVEAAQVEGVAAPEQPYLYP
ncbi:MAG: TIGR03943 family protein [Anaerolineales bacterium]|nr:TIGR03943 family protein [Anaerolineales bacterium]